MIITTHAIERAGPRWCILRTAPRSTLPLARSLNEAGFECWTPVEVRELRKGRKRNITEMEVPILPQYVFAKAKHLADLLALAHSPSLQFRVWDSEERRMVVKGHPHFSVFHVNGEVRPQSDDVLHSLRMLEADLQNATERRRERAKRKGPAPRFEAGEIVKASGGGFDGLRMEVCEPNLGKVVKLKHPNWMWTVEISAFKLERVHIEQAPPEQGAALAA